MSKEKGFQYENIEAGGPGNFLRGFYNHKEQKFYDLSPILALCQKNGQTKNLIIGLAASYGFDLAEFL